MQIDESDEQFRNRSFSMRKSSQPVSNVTFQSAGHQEKQLEQRILTDEGMQIDGSDEQFMNAPGSIRESVEPGSNVTRERRTHA
jgi:hypothetical protein